MARLKGRDFICLKDFDRQEIWQFLEVAAQAKRDLYRGVTHRPLEGKSLGMIFTKPSTRTRVAFEVAIFQLGGHGIFLSASELQLGRGETIEDTARVLSRYLDAVMIRTFDHTEVVRLAEAASVPVINGLTDFVHPCQALADLMTIWEKKGRLQGVRLAYVGDGNNVAHSLLLGGTKMGMHIVVASPEGYQPDPEVLELARRQAEESGGSVHLTSDPREAVRGADVVYTDVWVSMGQEAEKQQRLRRFGEFQVNADLMRLAREDAIFMHCLPAHRGEEVTDEVMDGKWSAVFDQAENRLHTHKAILMLLL